MSSKEIQDDRPNDEDSQANESCDDILEISVREITKQEVDILGNQRDPPPTTCHGSNAHVWMLDGDICSLFAHLQVKSIAFGSEHCLILTEDQKLYTYGSNTHGQLGQGDCDPRIEICLVPSLDGANIRHIACGERHNAVLVESGVLYTWGDSTHGQCGLGSVGVFSFPSKVDFSPSRKMSLDKGKLEENFQTLVRDISCGEVFSVAIDTKGCVWSWGSGCALGHGNDYEICVIPKIIKLLSNKRAICFSCGAYHCIVVTHDEFADDMLNIPSSPDYRTSSVSGTLYSDLKTKSTVMSSKIPFQQRKVYENAGSSPSTSLKQSHSETDLSKHKTDSEEITLGMNLNFFYLLV